MKTNILAAAAFLLLLGTAGGIERESLPLLPGLCLMALALAVFGATIHHINRRKEVHTMHTKREIVHYLADINTPANLNNIRGFVHRQFLKTPDSIQPGYFDECLTLLPDVPERVLPDLYSIMLGLAKEEKTCR